VQPDRNSLAARLDELNSLWKQAEQELASMCYSFPVEVKVSHDRARRESVYLGWRRCNENWRVCVGVVPDDATDQQPGWKPVAESAKEYRIALAVHYQKLKNAVVESRVTLLPMVEEAVAALRRSLD
jgi:hypothetical protein